MTKILLLTDSLGLSRAIPEICEYEKTWPFGLRSAGFQIHQVSIGGATSYDLVSQLHYHLSYKPDLVLLQVGIVDCAPRFMTKTELSITRKLGPVGNFMRGAFNKRWIKRLRNLTYVSKMDFQKNIKQIRTSINVPLVGISILPASMEYEKKLPGVSKNIRDYNLILKAESNSFLSLDNIPFTGIMSDHHHLNAEGHDYILDSLLELLKNSKFHPTTKSPLLSSKYE